MNEIKGIEKLENEVPSIIQQANALVIANDADNQTAANMLQSLRVMRKSVKETFAASIAAAKAAYNEVKGLNDKFDKPLETAENTVRARMGAYATAENARRAAIAAEAQKKADAEAKKAERKAERMGVPAPIMPATVVIAPAPVQTAGVSFRTDYSANVTDLMALIKAIAKGTAPIEAIAADTAYLNAIARAKKKEGEIMPGVVCVSKQTPIGGRL